MSGLEGNRKGERISTGEIFRLRQLLQSSDEVEDQLIARILGRRTLTDEEHERARDLLAAELMACVNLS